MPAIGSPFQLNTVVPTTECSLSLGQINEAVNPFSVPFCVPVNYSHVVSSWKWRADLSRGTEYADEFPIHPPSNVNAKTFPGKIKFFLSSRPRPMSQFCREGRGGGIFPHTRGYWNSKCGLLEGERKREERGRENGRGLGGWFDIIPLPSFTPTAISRVPLFVNAILALGKWRRIYRIKCLQGKYNI